MDDAERTRLDAELTARGDDLRGIIAILDRIDTKLAEIPRYAPAAVEHLPVRPSLLRRLFPGRTQW